MDRITHVIRWSFFVGIILPILFLTTGTIYAQGSNGFLIGQFHVIHGHLCSNYAVGETNQSSRISDAIINLTLLDKMQPADKSVSLLGKTDQDGFFTLFFPAYSEGELLVTARKGQQEWSAIIDISELNKRNELYVPITFETTLATDLYLSALEVMDPTSVSYSYILNSIQSEAASMDFKANNTFSEVSGR